MAAGSKPATSPPEKPSVLIPSPEGIRLRIRVKPGSSRQAVLGLTDLPGGEAAVLIAVSAPPEDGKANAAVAGLLSKLWGVPKTSIRVRTGATARTKILEVAGDPETLATRLSVWLGSLPPV
jgi:uncharacterized protein